jgi:ankyrin repeat protein
VADLRTSLHFAAAKGKTEIVDMLIQVSMRL